MIDHNPFPRPQKEDKPSAEHVLYWVWEREAIRIAKENNYTGALTQDPILAKYKFCNIRRRDDRVSRWVIENLLEPLKSEPDVWFASAIARYVNWPPAIQKLIDEDVIPIEVEDFRFERFAEVMDGMVGRGEKAWGGAYMIYPVREGPGTPKGHRVGKYILAPLVKLRRSIMEAIHDVKSVQALVEAMSQSYGWSTFMSGQVAADMTYIPPLHRADDVYDYAPMGPGSQRGLNRMLGKPLNHLWRQSEFNDVLIKVRNRIVYELDIDDMTLHDVQSAFCEMDKYWRELYSEGHPKTIYHPETRF